MTRVSDEDRKALIEMERQLLGYCETPQLKAMLLRLVRMLLQTEPVT